VSAVTRPGAAGLVVRGLLIAASASIVVLATLVTWPWPGMGPTADERRVADLQRLAHAVNSFRSEHDVLPATLARLPTHPVVPVHTLDPVTNRPYDYRPLGPLAYELCARFDEAVAGERRDFWWHDAGRYCYALETRAKPRAAVPASTAPADPPAADPPPDAAASVEPPRPDGTPSAASPPPAPPSGAASPTPP
jgi:hypothetical protein